MNLVVSALVKLMNQRGPRVPRQIERAGSVLYVHKNAKIVTTTTKLIFCTEKVPVLLQGQNFSSIRHLEPLTKTLYHNYTIATCNPLYPNVVKLEDGSFQQ